MRIHAVAGLIHKGRLGSGRGRGGVREEGQEKRQEESRGLAGINALFAYIMLPFLTLSAKVSRELFEICILSEEWPAGWQ